MLSNFDKQKQKLSLYLLNEFNVESTITSNDELILHTNPNNHDKCREFADKYWSNGCKIPLHHKIKHYIRNKFNG
jgi:hypothetical protein